MPEPPPAVSGLSRAGPEEATPCAGREPAEPAGFDDFFRFNYRDLVRWVRVASSADQAMAEDVAQETMLIVYRHWRDIDQPRQYAFKVAGRVASKAVRRELALRGLGENLEPGEVSSTGIPDLAVVRHDIDQMLRSLPLRQRQVAFLHWGLGYSTTEAAAILDVSPSSVRSHLHEARHRLQRALKSDLGTRARRAGGSSD